MSRASSRFYGLGLNWGIVADSSTARPHTRHEKRQQQQQQQRKVCIANERVSDEKVRYACGLRVRSCLKMGETQGVRCTYEMR